MNLYPKNQTATIDLALFKNPTAEYRGTPFWAWNNKLDTAQLMRQIDALAKMGMGGFHIHPRTGLATEYLGDEFMQNVKACVTRAQEKQMLVWLYDEDRWPSGSAGGKVTQDHRLRAKHLLFTPKPYDGQIGTSPMISGAQANRTGNGTLLARYQVHLQNGYLADYRLMGQTETDSDSGRVWYAYLETALESPWFNNQTYVDTLNKEAIQRFIELTHEQYKAAVGDCFGSVIPAIFTDEPQFVHKQYLTYADAEQDVVIPFTTDFFDTFRQTYDQDLLDFLPELFWELPDRKASLARYRYHDHLAERFTGAYADTVGIWCRTNGIALTGHMMEEPTLQTQARAVGEVMRSYRGFDLPGIDMLCDSHEYTTAKQAQSAANQFGAPGVLSELYGVTNWDFDFVGHKAQGDWQAALGVTVRVLHLALVSLAGEGKRDYPASLNYQVPWYEQYALVENYFARVNTLMTRGKRRVRIGVIHPVESYWLCFGPLEQTRMERQERDLAFKQITEWLLFGLLDFDFIAESLLPSQLPHPDTDSSVFTVGQATYDVVVVPGLRTLRETTIEWLERHSAAGGQVIFAGEIPSLIDAQPSDRAIRLAARTQSIPLTQGRILDALESMREVQIRLKDGSPADSILMQVRQDGDQRHIFFCNTDRLDPRPSTRIQIRGEWSLTVMDALTGDTSPLDSVSLDGWTQIEHDFTAHGSLLLSLSPDVLPARKVIKDHPTRSVRWTQRLIDPVPITLSEPNVLLLDTAEYRLNEEPWQPAEEILRLDNNLRRRFGYPLRMEALAQPWSYGRLPTPVDRLELRFTIETDIALSNLQLAIEDAPHVSVMIDSFPVITRPDGWFVDEAIGTIPLPPLAAGTHSLVVSLPFSAHTNPEACYLLGNFSVDVRGRFARLGPPVCQLAFGDWTRQGLPFYAGNVTYYCGFNIEQVSQLTASVPHFKAALLAASMDGGTPMPIAFAPFEARFYNVESGEHRLELTAFGSRVNTFGAVHNANTRTTWFGPNAWRTTSSEWSYEYQLKPSGILIAPELLDF